MVKGESGKIYEIGFFRVSRVSIGNGGVRDKDAALRKPTGFLFQIGDRSIVYFFKSEIIVDLLRVIGCGVELPSKIKGDIMKFDYDALRWSKIIICTDADEDGFQIRTLLLTMFYRLLPTLIEKERVFIAESPLFEITAKDDIYFAYNEQEKQQIIASLGDRKYTLQRSKGLGENEPEMMWKTTMNPATRRLIKITTADAADTATMFETLLGDDLESRKRFIAENAERYMAQADI